MAELKDVIEHFAFQVRKHGVVKVMDLMDNETWLSISAFIHD